MKVVVDASVALKWFFRSRGDEPDTAAALDLLGRVADERLTLVQPPHFVSEVSAVLARELPAAAETTLSALLDIEMRFAETEAIYARAMSLAAQLRHHLFDTLYHAVALEDGQARLITADDRYWRKARHLGAVVRLADFGAAAT